MAPYGVEKSLLKPQGMSESLAAEGPWGKVEWKIRLGQGHFDVGLKVWHGHLLFFS